MKTKLLIILMLFLSILGINQDINASSNKPTTEEEVAIETKSLHFEGKDQVRTLSYNSYEVTIEWETKGPVKEGDFFYIQLDSELIINTSLAEDSNIYYDGNIIAEKTIVKLKSNGPSHEDRDAIKYTFTDHAENYASIGGITKLVNGIKQPKSHIPKEYLNDAGMYKGDHKQTLIYTIGGEDHPIVVTHMHEPITNSLMYIINSWFNSTHLETNVYWNPTLEEKLIQGHIVIHNAKDFQMGDINTYGNTKDFIISQYMDSTYGKFYEPAGIQIKLERFSESSLTYETYETHYVSYDEIIYDGSENFTLNLTDLGIISD